MKGNLFKELTRKVDDLFTVGATIKSVKPIVDNSAMCATRDNTNNVHIQYEAIMDIHFNVNKNGIILEDKTFILGNATLKDVICKVTFTPKISYSDGRIAIKYDAKYELLDMSPYNRENKQHDVVFDKVIMNQNRTLKTKTINPRKFTVVISNDHPIAVKDDTTRTNKKIDDLTDPSETIKTLFTSSIAAKIDACNLMAYFNDQAPIVNLFLSSET